MLTLLLQTQVNNFVSSLFHLPLLYVSVFSVWMPRGEARVYLLSTCLFLSLSISVCHNGRYNKSSYKHHFLNLQKAMLCQDFVLCTAIAAHLMPFLHCNYAKDMTCCLQLDNTLSSCDIYTCACSWVYTEDLWSLLYLQVVILYNGAWLSLLTKLCQRRMGI